MSNIIELALLLLVVFLLGCLIGYWFRRFTAVDTPAEPEKPAAPPPAPKATSAPASARPTRRVAVGDVPPSTPKPAKTAARSRPATLKPVPKAAATPASMQPPPRTEIVDVPADSKPAKAVAEARPAGLDGPRGGVKDDLKTISGIGPKIEGSLNDLGIFHFDQIAKWTRADVAWVDEHLAFRGRIDREKWVEQAKAFANR
jgi:predicted flap endonuclease-1-like 5' DNA nuclease